MNDIINITRIPNTTIGLGAINNLGNVVKALAPSKILIVTDTGMVKSGIIDVVKALLEKGGYKFDIFDGCLSDPPISCVEKLGKKIKEAKYDLLIGVGGGSTMDTTKVASLIAANDDITTYDLISGKAVERAIPKILVPTTGGTGAEWTSAAVVSDDNADMAKKIVSSIKLLPDAVILDPELTRNLPQKITADTGMDALSHAIEAYTSNKANVISDMFAMTALKLICDNLPKAYSKGKKNIEARYNLAIAASMAAYAFNISSIGLTHIIANALVKKAHMSHGQACAMLLPYVMHFNLLANPAKFAKIAELMGEVVSGISLFDAAAKSVEAVSRLSRNVGIPQKLSDVGIKEADISAMVKEIHPASDFGIALLNPRDASLNDTTQILNMALRGNVQSQIEV